MQIQPNNTGLTQRNILSASPSVKTPYYDTVTIHQQPPQQYHSIEPSNRPLAIAAQTPNQYNMTVEPKEYHHQPMKQQHKQDDDSKEDNKDRKKHRPPGKKMNESTRYSNSIKQKRKLSFFSCLFCCSSNSNKWWWSFHVLVIISQICFRRQC